MYLKTGKCPNLLGYIDKFDDERNIVTEYCSGGNLHCFIEEVKKLKDIKLIESLLV